MGTSKEELDQKPHGPIEVVQEAVGNLVVRDALEERRQALLEKLQRDNSDAGMGI